MLCFHHLSDQKTSKLPLRNFFNSPLWNFFNSLVTYTFYFSNIWRFLRYICYWFAFNSILIRQSTKFSIIWMTTLIPEVRDIKIGTVSKVRVMRWSKPSALPWQLLILHLADAHYILNHPKRDWRPKECVQIKVRFFFSTRSPSAIWFLLSRAPVISGSGV